MNNTKYDQVILLARNKTGDIISACKWGKIWFYVYESKNEAGRIGLAYDNKYAILENSENYILNESGYNFTRDDLQLINSKQMVFLTEDQRVAINTAIRILGNSGSDMAEQAYYHLKTIIK